MPLLYLTNWPRNSCDFILLYYYSGTPLIRPQMGQKKIDRINVVAVLTRVFLQNVWRFFQAAKKTVAVITR